MKDTAEIKVVPPTTPTGFKGDGLVWAIEECPDDASDERILSLFLSMGIWRNNHTAKYAESGRSKILTQSNGYAGEAALSPPDFLLGTNDDNTRGPQHVGSVRFHRHTADVVDMDGRR